METKSGYVQMLCMDLRHAASAPFPHDGLSAGFHELDMSEAPNRPSPPDSPALAASSSPTGLDALTTLPSASPPPSTSLPTSTVSA